jgi:ribonucleoside-diphosphate reductase alpha chain
MVQGHNTIRNATSILDYVFRSIGYDYLGRKDFVHVKAVDEVPEGGEATSRANNGTSGVKHETPQAKKHAGEPEPAKLAHAETEFQASLKSQVIQAKVQGYSGEQCENCGSMRVKQNGTCKVCEDCGMTTGCS